MNGKNIRILLVEDNPGDVRLIRTFLAEAGVDKAVLISAGTLARGMELLDGGAIDAVLLDLGLPDSQGLDTLHAVREKCISVPVVVLSGLQDEDIAVSAVQKGAQDYLVKGKVDGNLLWRSICYAVERKKSEAALLESESKYRLLAENASDVIWTADLNLKVNYISPSVAAMQGYTPEEIVGIPLAKSMIAESFKKALALFKTGMEAEKCGKEVDRAITMFESEFIRKDGSTFWAETIANFIRDSNGCITGLQGVTRDISERKRLEHLLVIQATHDALTGLPNRALLIDRVSMAIARAQRNKKKLALMLLDLDRFKTVNDTLGHSVGDGLLKAVSVKLAETVRLSDTVARIGGDEFTILLPEISGSNEAAEIARRVLDIFKLPLPFDGHSISTSTSIGIAVYPEDGTSFETLLKNADIAMYRVKDGGRNNYCFYTDPVGQENSCTH